MSPFREVEIKAFEFQNKIRQDPQSLIPILYERLQYFVSGSRELRLPGKLPFVTVEGPRAV